MNLNPVWTIVEFIVAFSLLAFFHELGHFLISRLFNIEVEEFGLGFPPRLVKLFTWKGTEFTLNWIPFGAFVRPKGENDPSIPGGLAAANPWKRLAVLVGGPLMNLLLAVVLFAVVFSQTGSPDTTKTMISDVYAGSPAETAGIQPGDIIVSINGVEITSTDQISAVISANLGKEIQIVYERDGQQGETALTPRVDPPEGEYPVGIAMTNPVIKTNFFQALVPAVAMTYDQSKTMLELPIRLIQGQVDASQARLVSPKGMYDIYAQVREREAAAEAEIPGLALINMFWFFGSISVALGITNLLPLPALDGGRILFALPEIILRKRVPAKYENMVHMVGFLLLLGLMFFLLFQDIINPVVLP